MSEERPWTPEESEAAFKTFGNFMLRLNALYAKYGERTPENTVAGAQEMLTYLEGLPAFQLEQILHYYAYIDLAKHDVQLMIGFILLGRRALS